MNEQTLYKGSCHCGAVRFQVAVQPDERIVSEGNCSICRKKGFLHPDRADRSLYPASGRKLADIVQAEHGH